LAGDIFARPIVHWLGLYLPLRGFPVGFQGQGPPSVQQKRLTGGEGKRRFPQGYARTELRIDKGWRIAKVKKYRLTVPTAGGALLEVARQLSGEAGVPVGA
jgi:hypothetical protein